VSSAKWQGGSTPVITCRQRARKPASRPVRLNLQSCIATVQGVYQSTQGAARMRRDPRAGGVGPTLAGLTSADLVLCRACGSRSTFKASH